MSEKKTKADVAAEMIKDDILSGMIQPNTQLKIQEVSELYKIGFTPIREALNKLTQTGLVEERPLKGFFVTPLSIDEIEDIFKVRKIIETKAFELAIKNGDDSWEGSIISAAHQLKKTIDLEGKEKRGDNRSKKKSKLWATMMSACNSNSLLEIQEQLWIQCERYREVWHRITEKDEESVLSQKAAITTTTNLKQEIDDLVNSLLDRDTKTAIKIVHNDLDTLSKMYIDFLNKHQDDLYSKNPKLKNKSTR